MARSSAGAEVVLVGAGGGDPCLVIPSVFADSNALLADRRERGHELSFIPNFLLLCSSLENTSAGHCIWGFVQGFAVGLPLQHPTASAPPTGDGVTGKPELSPRLGSTRGSAMCVCRGGSTGHTAHRCCPGPGTGKPALLDVAGRVSGVG